MSEHPRAARADRIAAREFDGKAVVIVLDRGELHTLNEVGTFIWNRIDGRSIDELVTAVTTEFDVDAERAEADVRELLESLRAAGAIKLATGEP